MNMTNINTQLLTIEAAVTQKKEYIYQAAMLDPHTSSELSIDDIISLCDDLIEAMRRYMSLPRETVDAFCAKHGLGAPVINTGNPGEYTIKELAEETLRQIPESKSKLVYRPLPSDDPKRRRPDIALARELLGWEPKVPLKEGLSKTIEYFRAQQIS
jgi:nucleoside-diphosphate-sugar epimerase